MFLKGFPLVPLNKDRQKFLSCCLARRSQRVKFDSMVFGEKKKKKSGGGSSCADHQAERDCCVFLNVSTFIAPTFGLLLLLTEV